MKKPRASARTGQVRPTDTRSTSADRVHPSQKVLAWNHFRDAPDMIRNLGDAVGRRRVASCQRPTALFCKKVRPVFDPSRPVAMHQCTWNETDMKVRPKSYQLDSSDANKIVALSRVSLTISTQGDP